MTITKWPGRDLNRTPPEHEPRELPNQYRVPIHITLKRQHEEENVFATCFVLLWNMASYSSATHKFRIFEKKTDRKVSRLERDAEYYTTRSSLMLGSWEIGVMMGWTCRPRNGYGVMEIYEVPKRQKLLRTCALNWLKDVENDLWEPKVKRWSQTANNKWEWSSCIRHFKAREQVRSDGNGSCNPLNRMCTVRHKQMLKYGR